MRVTHVGTATTLLEIGPWRILTDPALDPAGGAYRFAVGIGSRKTEAPALPRGGLLPLDLVLVSHDHHADNLDAAGRELLPQARTVLTTVSGAKRLRGNAVGLAVGATHELVKDGVALRVTGTPARHGPPGIGLIEPETIGFLLEWAGQKHGPVWISGDTVLSGTVERFAQATRCGTAIVHLGGVKFALTGPARFTFTAAEAARVAALMGARTIVPVHYSGWVHFVEGRAAAEAAFAAAGLAERVRWLVPGTPTELEE